MIYEALYEFDQHCRLTMGGQVLGVDEAGRGPLAGPVFAGAVILPPGLTFDGLRDSKKVTAKRREALFEEIKKNALAFAIGAADVEEIDRLNILGATFLAMQRAVEQIGLPYAYTLIDGNRMPPFVKTPAKCVVHGDDTSASIAAASILAKVARDRYLEQLDGAYPVYGFAKHKGYGTKAHVEALLAHGPCPAHRRSFLTKILPNEEK